MPAWRSATEIAYVSDRREKPGIYANEQLIAAADGALAGPSFGPDGAIAFNAIAGSRSRLVVNGRNIADADEDVFPFRPQWITNDELLYTADGRIKRRPAAGGAARTIEFSADVSFTRPAFTPKRHRFDVAGPQRAAGITHPAISPDGTQVVFTALGDLWLMSVDGSAAPRGSRTTRRSTPMRRGRLTVGRSPLPPIEADRWRSGSRSRGAATPAS